MRPQNPNGATTVAPKVGRASPRAKGSCAQHMPTASHPASIRQIFRQTEFIRDRVNRVGVPCQALGARHKSGYRRDSSAKQLESERMSYARQETPLWGSLVSCGRLAIGPTQRVPRAFARESGGRQPPRRLPACPTSRQRCHSYVALKPCSSHRSPARRKHDGDQGAVQENRDHRAD